MLGAASSAGPGAARRRQYLPNVLFGDTAFVHQAGVVHGVDGRCVDTAEVIHQSDVHEQQLVGAVVDAGAEGQAEQWL